MKYFIKYFHGFGKPGAQLKFCKVATLSVKHLQLYISSKNWFIKFKIEGIDSIFLKTLKDIVLMNKGGRL